MLKTRSSNIRLIALVALLGLLLAVLLVGAAFAIEGGLGATGDALGELAARSSCGCSGGSWYVICPDVYICPM